jgi:hypothetical protein
MPTGPEEPTLEVARSIGLEEEAVGRRNVTLYGIFRQ